MTIQIPNPGTGNGTTGDNEFVMWIKVKDNFNNQTHAASRLVGDKTGDLIEIGFSGIGLKNPRTLTNEEVLDKNSSPNTGFYVIKRFDENVDIAYSSVLQMHYTESLTSQLVIKNGSDTQIKSYLRLSKNGGGTDYLTASLYNSLNPVIYDTTTALGANVVVTETGKMLRSTSSERYKDIIADLELDDVSYANAMQLAPIVYRSTADADNPAYHYYSFSAEALGAFDPAFVLWRDTETVTDENGNTTEQPLDERQAEGINLNAIVAFLHATNVKQGKLIGALEAKVAALEKEV